MLPQSQPMFPRPFSHRSGRYLNYSIPHCRSSLTNNTHVLGLSFLNSTPAIRMPTYIALFRLRVLHYSFLFYVPRASLLQPSPCTYPPQRIYIKLQATSTRPNHSQLKSFLWPQAATVKPMFVCPFHVQCYTNQLCFAAYQSICLSQISVQGNVHDSILWFLQNR